MKIGIICYPTIGGSGIVATELGKSLAGMGHQVHFISYQEPFRLNTFINNVRFHKVEISKYPLFDYQPYELSLTNKIVEVVESEKLDILHTHYAIPHASAAYLAQHILESKNIKIPYITTLHGTDITLFGKDPSFKPVISFAINQSNAVTSVSKNLKKQTLDIFNVEKEIYTIPNFIDYKKSQTPVNQEIKNEFVLKNEKIIAHASNFRKVKRIPDVVQIFYEIQKQIPAKLLLMGDGPEINNIKRLVNQLNINEKVIFLGQISNIINILKISDLFLLTSEHESFGLSVLEAFACGVPAITSNTGGLPEININGKTGFLSPVGNIQEMTKNALTILKSSDFFSKNALSVAKNFECKKIVPLYEKLYLKMLNI